MSDTLTKEIQLTPLSIETKTFTRKDGSGTFDKVEITAELPNVGKTWLKAFPEKAHGIKVGLPFWAIVKATPKANGGYFYYFETVDAATTVYDPKPQPPRDISDDDAIRAMHLSIEALVNQRFDEVKKLLTEILESKSEIPF